MYRKLTVTSCIQIINDELELNKELTEAEADIDLFDGSIDMEPWQLVLALYAVESKCGVMLSEDQINEMERWSISNIVKAFSV